MKLNFLQHTIWLSAIKSKFLYNFFPRTGFLPECENCLKQCLALFKKIASSGPGSFDILKNMKIISKLHMQYCAILSQQNKHIEALNHAKYAVNFTHQTLQKTIQIAEEYVVGNEDSSAKDLVSSVNSSSATKMDLYELVSSKILPILQELMSRCVGSTHKRKVSSQLKNKRLDSRKLDMRNLFGYMENKETAAGINIGNIMQMSPLTLPDLLAKYNNSVELSREALLEKIALLTASYFCMATEKRFLNQNAPEDGGTDRKESEFWHAKALELSCCFLPGSCPIVGHIWISYQKHYSPLQEAIVT